MNNTDSEPAAKASFPEKLVLLWFVFLPLLWVTWKKRLHRAWQRYCMWSVRNINTLITINLVIVLAGVILLFALRLWLTRVRGW